MSLTFSFLSKIISFLANAKTFEELDLAEAPSSNLSHGNGCRRENSKRKKQLPLVPAKMNAVPSAHRGLMARPRQRDEWPMDGEAKARRNMPRNPERMRTIPRLVAMQRVSYVPLETLRRMKFL